METTNAATRSTTNCAGDTDTRVMFIFIIIFLLPALTSFLLLLSFFSQLQLIRSFETSCQQSVLLIESRFLSPLCLRVRFGPCSSSIVCSFVRSLCFVRLFCLLLLLCSVVSSRARTRLSSDLNLLVCFLFSQRCVEYYCTVLYCTVLDRIESDRVESDRIESKWRNGDSVHDACVVCFDWCCRAFRCYVVLYNVLLRIMLMLLMLLFLLLFCSLQGKGSKAK
mmetsp:Transcript_49883/g.120875  ORF Transcript_49883/g.120875 Transcript_49883/m.120875 type:complete len:223 (-) Transcript_49883:450-1118(-)